MKSRKSDKYEDEPVFYCSKCTSLRILSIVGTNICYCDKCGSTEVVEGNIKDWEKKVEERKV